MGYLFPPTVVTVTSAALIAGTINGAILAAPPGATDAYRLYGYSVVLNTNVPAATLVHGFYDDGGGRILRFGLGANTREAVRLFPFPGIQFNPAAGINYSLTSSAAGGTVLINTYYYLDTL